MNLITTKIPKPKDNLKEKNNYADPEKCGENGK